MTGGRAGALGSLAEGDVSRWVGLPEGCTRDDVEEALGPAHPSQDLPGRLGATPLVYRRYRPGPAAPHGVEVWFSEEEAEVVEITYPTLLDSLEDALGRPEVVLPSALGFGRRQWAWPARGLAVHVEGSRPGTVVVLYGFPPCSVQEFTSAPLSNVREKSFPAS